MKILVSYDISSDRSRKRSAAILLKYGIRLQESLFFCELTETNFRKMKAALLKYQGKNNSVLLFIMPERINVQTLSGTIRLKETSKNVFF